MSLLVGIFVGGRATRFGGAAKGMLPAPDGGEPIAARLARVCREATSGSVVLVGRAAAYDVLGLPHLEDRVQDVGPLGGLAALLAEAERNRKTALAIAGDLPYLTTELVARLVLAAPGAPATAPRLSGKWQPLFARYEPGRCLPLATTALAEGRLATRAVLEALGDEAVELPLDADETALLDDWDRPEDMTRSRG